MSSERKIISASTAKRLEVEQGSKKRERESKRTGTKKRVKSQELQVSTKLQVISFYIKVTWCKL